MSEYYVTIYLGRHTCAHQYYFYSLSSQLLSILSVCMQECIHVHYHILHTHS